jgi:hypothetical protein
MNRRNGWPPSWHKNFWQQIWSRKVFANLSDVAVPLTSLFISHGTPWEKHIFFKLIYFLIISYMRDKVVYCCWVSDYVLINYVILFIYLLFQHLAVPLGRVRGTPVGNQCSKTFVSVYRNTLPHITKVDNGMSRSTPYIMLTSALALCKISSNSLPISTTYMRPTNFRMGPETKYLLNSPITLGNISEHF